MLRLRLQLLLLLVAGSVAQGATYVKTDGILVDPILDTSGNVHLYDGNNLESNAWLYGADLKFADLKAAEKRMIVLFDELKLLKDFEQKDTDLADAVVVPGSHLKRNRHTRLDLSILPGTRDGHAGRQVRNRNDRVPDRVAVLVAVIINQFQLELVGCRDPADQLAGGELGIGHHQQEIGRPGFLRLPFRFRSIVLLQRERLSRFCQEFRTPQRLAGGHLQCHVCPCQRRHLAGASAILFTQPGVGRWCQSYLDILDPRPPQDLDTIHSRPVITGNDQEIKGMFHFFQRDDEACLPVPRLLASRCQWGVEMPNRQLFRAA
mgnify:CR=1 FL=1